MTEQNLQTRLLDGTATAAAIREDLAAEITKLTANGSRRPGLAVVIIGDDPASHIYVKNKIAACKKVGIESFHFAFPADVTPDVVLRKIFELNEDTSVDGILVQLPLPKHLNTEEILAAISPEKDADGLHSFNLGLLTAGKPGPRPCTPSGVIAILKRYNVEMAGKNAVVIGRSNLVGKPVALMLLEQHATVTICHSRSQNLDQIARNADILVVAAGKPHLVKGSWIKPGAVVVDVGIHRSTNDAGESKLIGDVDFDQASKVASMITPVPGGIGPMTIAMLLSNTLDSYKRRMNGPAK
ncbi:MAG TPA: bifunctional methylenetetrahydrofolate dehydrogenase/methenyltetrahydrofolate cyclohydrolase FolD [Candidatus Obscuribacterales bacterium]